jgi:hypothetical protein
MLTPLGWRLAPAVVALLLLAAWVALFVVTTVGQEFLCGRAGMCLAVRR